jgi:hypothetical protein
MFCWRVVDMGACSSSLVPGNSARKLVDGLQEEARWEPQEEGMMSTAASLSSVVKPRLIEPVGESQTSEGDAC